MLRKTVQAGFTLIELLVVIAIIGLIIVLVLPNIRNLRDEQNLRSAVSELQVNLRQAQNNAASGVKCASNNKPALDWYIKVENATTLKLEPSCLAAASLPSKTVNLTNFNAQITDINGCASFTNSKISFSNISQEAIFNLPIGCSVTDQLSIVVGSTNTAVTPKSIIIESGGRIYVP